MKLKVTALFLLTVFAFVLMPWPLLHNFIADHTTEQDTHCREFHGKLGTHIEASHGHCSIFDSTSLIYDKAKASANFNLLLELTAVYYTAIKASVSKAVAVNLPSRAPPVS